MKHASELQKDLALLIDVIEHNSPHITLKSSGIWTNTGWHRDAGSIEACEIVCFFEGETILTIGDREYTSQSGEIYCYDLSEKSYCEPGSFKVYFLTLTSDSAHVFEQLQQGIQNISPAQPFRSSDSIAGSFQRILSEEAREKPYNATVIAHYLSEIFIDLYRQYEPESLSPVEFPYEPRKGMITDEVMKILNDKYQEDITLADIGSALSLNPRYINAVFKEISGTTIRQHLIRIRLGAAKKLLRYTSMHVTDIALETGFSDGQHFCRSFKEHEGITPLEYRKSSKT